MNEKKGGREDWEGREKKNRGFKRGKGEIGMGIRRWMVDFTTDLSLKIDFWHQEKGEPETH